MPKLKIANTGFSEVYRPEEGDPVVEIVLVHGLQGHPYNTWACDPPKPVAEESDAAKPNRWGRFLENIRSGGNAKLQVQHDLKKDSADPGAHRERPQGQIAAEKENKKVFWPADLLSGVCPKARISVYGYHSRIVGYRRVNKDHLYQLGKNFYNQLALYHIEDTPIIFIAHSLGGIVLKEALVLSYDSEEKEYHSIIEDTAAVVFMGTPHRGSKEWALTGETARRVASALLLNNDPSLLNNLGLKNGELFRSGDKFTQIWEKLDFAVKTYQEGKPLFRIGLSHFGQKVVPDESSLLSNPKEHAESLAADHRRMCRFSGVTDENWRKVAPQLKRYYEKAAKTPRRPPVAPPVGFEDLIASLRYRLPDDSEYNVELPLEKTCDWILNSSQFRKWSSQPGQWPILNIVGNVGSGKSTLMRHIFRYFKCHQKTSADDTVACFLSHKDTDRRGAIPIILRSLLIQLLQIPSFQIFSLNLIDQYRFKLSANGEVKWSSRELEEALVDLLRKPRLGYTIIFVDGADEYADAESIMELLLSLFPSNTQSVLKVCVSGRSTSPLLGSRCERIIVEESNYMDIAFYVERKLHVGKLLTEDQFRSLKEGITKKADGIFLWVVLVKDLIQSYLKHGHDFNYLQGKLDAIPKRLEELYRDILLRIPDETKPETIHVLQWVLFSARRLTIAEWHHALALMQDPYLRSIDEWKRSEMYTESDELLILRIRSICGGLVDVKNRLVLGPTKSASTRSIGSSVVVGAASFESLSNIDVIHGSVRTFLLNCGGFKDLDPLIRDPAGEGHAYILEICIRYSFFPEMVKAFDRKASRPPISPASMPERYHQINRRLAKARSNSSLRSLSLGSSASSVQSYVADNSSPGFQPPKMFLSSSSMKTRDEDKTQAVLDYLNRSYPATGLMTKPSSYPNSTTSTADEQVLNDPPCLWQYCSDMLVFHAISAQRARVKPDRPLEVLRRHDWNILASTRADTQMGATLAYFAAQSNLTSWLSFLPRDSWYCEGGELRYPILVAAQRGHGEVLKMLLLSQPTSARCTDHAGRTIFHIIAAASNEALLNIILRVRVGTTDLPFAEAINDIRDNNSDTAMHIAARNTSSNVIKGLSQLGADFNQRDGCGRTPLHTSCKQEPCDLGIVNALVDSGCSVLASDWYDCTALDMAITRGHEDVAEYLRLKEKAENLEAVAKLKSTEALAKARFQCIQIMEQAAKNAEIEKAKAEQEEDKGTVSEASLLSPYLMFSRDDFMRELYD